MQKGKHARENRCVRLTGSCTRVSGVYCYFSFIFILYYHTGEYIISLKCLIYMWRARWLTCWRLVRILTSNNDALYLIPTVCDNLINYRIIIIIIIINHAARSKCSKMFTDKLDCTTSLSPRLFSKCTAMSHKSGVRHTHTHRCGLYIAWWRQCVSGLQAAAAAAMWTSECEVFVITRSATIMLLASGRQSHIQVHCSIRHRRNSSPWLSCHHRHLVTTSGHLGVFLWSLNWEDLVRRSWKRR